MMSGAGAVGGPKEEAPLAASSKKKITINSGHLETETIVEGCSQFMMFLKQLKRLSRFHLHLDAQFAIAGLKRGMNEFLKEDKHVETEKSFLLTGAIPKHKLVKTTRNDKKDQGKIVTDTSIESNSPDDKLSVSSESGSSSTQSDRSYRKHKAKIAKTKKPHKKGNADHRRNKGGWHSVQNKRIPKLEKYCEDSGQNLEKYLV